VLNKSSSREITKSIDAYIGGRVRRRRVELGLSQTALADQLNLTFQQVQKYEKGTNRVSGSRMVQMANALDVSTSYFFDGAPSVSQKAQPPDVLGAALGERHVQAMLGAYLRLRPEAQAAVRGVLEAYALADR
jgi:transcriptional regulator with XRE-family HTH domain